MTLFRRFNFLQYPKNKFSVKYVKKDSPDHVNLSFVSYEPTSSENLSNPLVLMHGLFGSKSNWSTLCNTYLLKTDPKRRIIAVDARNHGDSPHHPSHSYPDLALDLKVFMKTLDIEKVCLLGHSMGGAAAMVFALKFPELLEKLIVVDISPISIKLEDISGCIKAMQNVNIPSSVSISAARTAADLQLLKNGMEPKTLRRFMITNLIRTSNGSYGWRINLPALLMNYKNLVDFPRENGQVFSGPTLFVGGAQSRYLDKADVPKIKKIFTNSEFKFIEGAGHLVHNDKRKEFSEVTLEFLNKNKKN